MPHRVFVFHCQGAEPSYTPSHPPYSPKKQIDRPRRRPGAALHGLPRRRLRGRPGPLPVRGHDQGPPSLREVSPFSLLALWVCTERCVCVISGCLSAAFRTPNQPPPHTQTQTHTPAGSNRASGSSRGGKGSPRSCARWARSARAPRTPRTGCPSWRVRVTWAPPTRSWRCRGRRR